MSARGAAITHFLTGGLLFLYGLSKLASPSRLYEYTEYKSETVAQYGFGASMTLIGVSILLVGLFTFRASKRPPPEQPSSLVYVWETPPILGYVLGVICAVFAAFPLAALVPYLGQRGFVFGQVLAALFLSGLFGVLGFFLLHYRRTTELDPSAQRLTIRFGKPFIFRTKSFGFDEFDSVGLQITYGKRGARFYRAMASGEGKKPYLVAVTMSESQGRQNVAAIAQVTGWTALEAAL